MEFSCRILKITKNKKAKTEDTTEDKKKAKITPKFT
jgi:hypothetical protein